MRLEKPNQRVSLGDSPYPDVSGCLGGFSVNTHPAPLVNRNQLNFCAFKNQKSKNAPVMFSYTFLSFNI